MRSKALATTALLLLLATAALAAPRVEYTVSLANPAQHLVHVSVLLPAGAAQREVQLPVWNALYQVRDFSQYLRSPRARDSRWERRPVQKVDKTTWRISGAEKGVIFEYDIIAKLSGPFGAELNQEHAFFNLAQILVHPVDGRKLPVTIAFTNVPAHWLVATALRSAEALAPAPAIAFSAPNYDELVDCPVEIGRFAQAWVTEGGATYRLVVDAEGADYDLDGLARIVRLLVKSEIEWMDDRPFSEYVFIFHFSREPDGGGMEHANSAAIELNTGRMESNPLLLPALIAHEFFHLWNVKRIRPQSLEPVDYTRENYSDALWFSEGVTSTVADYMLLRTGLLDERSWLAFLARNIRELERRPARLTQSAADASLDTWLDKYPEYKLPERSISYYNKGELLGVLLDLAIRDATHGERSLRDVFRWMNQHYARQHKFYPDTAGVQQAVEAVSQKDFSQFFAQYVAGVSELPYDRYLNTVGLRLERHKTVAADAGFRAVRNFDALPIVVSVDQDSDAARQGLKSGDTIVLVNGKPAWSNFESSVALMRVGQSVKLRVIGESGQHDVKIKLAGKEQEAFRIRELDHVTPEQRARRAAWLTASDQSPKGTPAGTVRAQVAH